MYLYSREVWLLSPHFQHERNTILLIGLLLLSPVLILGRYLVMFEQRVNGRNIYKKADIIEVTKR